MLKILGATPTRPGGVTAAYPLVVTLADLDLQLFESSLVCSCGWGALQTSNFCSCRKKREQVTMGQTYIYIYIALYGIYIYSYLIFRYTHVCSSAPCTKRRQRGFVWRLWCVVHHQRSPGGGELGWRIGEPGNLCQKVEICFDECDVFLPDPFARDQGMCQQWDGYRNLHIQVALPQLYCFCYCFAIIFVCVSKTQFEPTHDS